MGLDSVELLIAFEEAFDIRIEDDEASRIRTPANVIEVVMSKVAGCRAPEVCLTHRAYNHLRRLMVESFNIPRKGIAPNNPLAGVPLQHRSAFLSAIGTQLSKTPPLRLRRPIALNWSLLITSIGLGIAGSAAFPRVGGIPAFGVGLATATAAGLLSNLATRRFATEFPPEIATVGALARWLMVHKPTLAASGQETWTREQVAARVREIVIAQLRCEKHYREDARFIEDLGMD